MNQNIQANLTIEHVLKTYLNRLYIFSNKLIKRYHFFYPLDTEDFYSLAYISIVKAIKAFQINNTKKFENILFNIHKQNVIKYALKFMTNKHKILNTWIRIDNFDQSSYVYPDLTNQIYKNEVMTSFISFLQTQPKNIQKLFKLELKGYTFLEISKKLQKSKKWVYRSRSNTINAFRIKVLSKNKSCNNLHLYI